MRPRYRSPRNRRYFHTKPKIDKRDMSILKRKIESIEQKKDKKNIKERFL
jgi:hypothetical protein